LNQPRSRSHLTQKRRLDSHLTDIWMSRDHFPLK
jgi:hypothetical protein